MIDERIDERAARPFLIVTLVDDTILATAQRTDLGQDLWLITLADGEEIRVVGEESMNTLLTALSRELAHRDVNGGTKYHREDPETAEPLPAGTSGFSVGRGPGRRALLSA